jgi:hypothetical protein
MKSSKKFCLLFGVAVLCFGVVGNVHAGMLYALDDPEVTVTGHLETTFWHGDDNGWDYANDNMWVWGAAGGPLEGTTHKYLMAKHNEDSGVNPVTVELALGNGTYDIGYVWYRHGHIALSSVALTVEGANYDHKPSDPGSNKFGTESVATGVTVTDGALTLVFGNVVGSSGNWFTAGQLDASYIPEPSTLVLTVFGLIGLAAFIRRRK